MARRAISENPHSPYAPEMLRIAGESSYQTGDTPEAIGYLQRYLDTTSIDKAEPSALYILGINAYQQGEPRPCRKATFTPSPSSPMPSDSRPISISDRHFYNKATWTQPSWLWKSLSSRLRPISARNSILQLCRYTHGRRTHTIRQFGGIDGRLPRTYPNSRFAPQVQEYLVTGYITDNNYDQAPRINQRHKPPDSCHHRRKTTSALHTRDPATSANNRTTQAPRAIP